MGRPLGRTIETFGLVLMAASLAFSLTGCGAAAATGSGASESAWATTIAAPAFSEAQASAAPTPWEFPSRTPVSIVTGNPFASCAYTGPGTLTPNVTYEPSAATRIWHGGPLIVALYYQGYIERPNMNSGLGFVLASSLDGGATWADRPLPFGTCYGNRVNDGVSNGRVSVGADGTVYVAAAAGDGSTPIRLVLTASSDLGQTWTTPTFDTMASGDCHADEPSIAADPTRVGRAYAVWVDGCWPRASSLAMASTLDGGKTWSAPRDLGLGDHPWVNWPSILIDAGSGLLHLFFSDCQNGKSTSYSVLVSDSADAGATWSAPVVIGQGSGSYGPDPSPAFGPNGSLVVAWDSDQGVWLSSATDSAQWSPPVSVADIRNRPSLAITSDGLLAVSVEPNSVVLSSNAGKTFSGPRFFTSRKPPAGFAGDYAIASLAVGPDFHIVFECMAGDQISTCFW